MLNFGGVDEEHPEFPGIPQNHRVGTSGVNNFTAARWEGTDLSVGNVRFGCEIGWQKMISIQKDPKGADETSLGGGFKYLLFSPLCGELIQFDSYFSDGLKPPTRSTFCYLPKFKIDVQNIHVWREMLLMEEILHHLDVHNTVNNGINYLSRGAGVLPSNIPFKGSHHFWIFLVSMLSSGGVFLADVNVKLWQGWRSTTLIWSFQGTPKIKFIKMINNFEILGQLTHSTPY